MNTLQDPAAAETAQTTSVQAVDLPRLVGLLESSWNHLSASLVGMRISDPRWKPAVDWLNANRQFQKPIPRLPNVEMRNPE